MKVTPEQVRLAVFLQNLELPQDDLGPVARGLSVWLTAMEHIERELGPHLPGGEFTPPAFPGEES